MTITGMVSFTGTHRVLILSVTVKSLVVILLVLGTDGQRLREISNL